MSPFYKLIAIIVFFTILGLCPTIAFIVFFSFIVFALVSPWFAEEI